MTNEFDTGQLYALMGVTTAIILGITIAGLLFFLKLARKDRKKAEEISATLREPHDDSKPQT